MQRIVVKIGSSSLTTREGGLNRKQVDYFAAEIAELIRQGTQVLLVTSGAVAAGYMSIGYKERPKILAAKQASAAVGQALLMQAYQEAFSRFGLPVAQLLLTRSDFSNRKRATNALMTIEVLLQKKAVPIINENDTISVDELKFGDNDTLSALTANLVKAQHLLIVTDTDGLYSADPRKNANATRIGQVDEINEAIMRIAGGAGSAVGTGGMRSKIEAARIAMRGGVPAFVGTAAEPGDLLRALKGQGKGTYFHTHSETLPMKKQWVGFLSKPQGTIQIDQGAEKALLFGGKSLLPAGVIAVTGEFHPGDVVEVQNAQKQTIGRGVSNYASWQIRAVAGMSLKEAQKRVDAHPAEVIHRDEWFAFNH
ncbi:MAG TPA: glutamate 5-kinase [Bacilli bacterium]